MHKSSYKFYLYKLQSQMYQYLYLQCLVYTKQLQSSLGILGKRSMF